jgi:hypothetical protein
VPSAARPRESSFTSDSPQDGSFIDATFDASREKMLVAVKGGGTPSTKRRRSIWYGDEDVRTKRMREIQQMQALLQ